ncbi:MAG: Ig-like domain-containing protein, partial [Gemmatimonadaceae bacterium]
SETKTDAKVLTVIDAPVNTVAVSLTPSTINAVQTSQASAVLKDAAGNTLSGRSVAWASSNPNVALIDGASAFITAVSAGTANIFAFSEGKVGVQVLTVTIAPVANVAVTLAQPDLPVGQNTQASATLTDAQGRSLAGRAITWNSADQTVATVSLSGMITAVKKGSSIITATSEGKSGTATVNVP